MNKEKIIKLLMDIKKQGFSCFCSESQLRDLFAFEILKNNQNAIIMPEYTPNGIADGYKMEKSEKISFDLLVSENNDDNTLFEFKYITKKMNYNFNDHITFNLSNQNDTTNTKYRIWKDINRLESYVNDKKYNIKNGYLIFIACDKSYISKQTKGIAKEFDTTRGLHLKGTRKWNSAGKSKKSMRFVNDIEIVNDYDFDYELYSTCNGKTFYYLVVEVK